MKKWLIITLFIFLTTQLMTKDFNELCKNGNFEECDKKSFFLDVRKINESKKRDYHTIQTLDTFCMNEKDMIACSSIAKIYAKYHDYKNTIRYYEMGCNETITQSCYELGKYHLVQDRNDDTTNYEYYLAIACEDGNSSACKDLAIHLESQQNSQSQFYYERACTLGLKDYCH